MNMHMHACNSIFFLCFMVSINCMSQTSLPLPFLAFPFFMAFKVSALIVAVLPYAWATLRSGSDGTPRKASATVIVVGGGGCCAAQCPETTCPSTTPDPDTTTVSTTTET